MLCNYHDKAQRLVVPPLIRLCAHCMLCAMDVWRFCRDLQLHVKIRLLDQITLYEFRIIWLVLMIRTNVISSIIIEVDTRNL